MALSKTSIRACVEAANSEPSTQAVPGPKASRSIGTGYWSKPLQRWLRLLGAYELLAALFAAIAVTLTIRDPSNREHPFLLAPLVVVVVWTAVAGGLTVRLNPLGLRLSLILQTCLVPLLVIPSLLGFGIRLPLHFTLSLGTEPPVLDASIGLLAQVPTDEPNFYFGFNVLAFCSVLVLLSAIRHKGPRRDSGLTTA